MRARWLGLMLAGAGACSSYGDNASPSAPPRDAGVDSPIVVVAPGGATCDTSKEPKDAPDCLADSQGVFVDATSGNNTGAGTRAMPVKSLTTALGLLAGRKRLFLCAGTYDERVTLPAGVSAYGGFACGTWAYAGAAARIAPAERGVVVSIVGDASGPPVPVELADLEIEAATATDPGESSVAVLVARTAVTIRRSKISAANGVSGNPGLDAAAPATAAPAGNSGLAATNPGAGTSNPACPTSIGGNGGGIVGSMNDGMAGKIALMTPSPSTATGLGGASAANNCANASKGKDGSDGVVGSGGTVATALGTLTAAGWTPAPGTDGGVGGNGQGGGGGAVRVALVAVAGGGGAGGCGAPGGTHGQSGGGSIAIAALDSAVTLDGTTLVAKNGGSGGVGGKGAQGQAGGAGGTGDSAKGCSGGAGGTGGAGGGGAGGTGGVSVGVLYTIPPPTIDAASTLTVGMSGAPGAAGMGAGGILGLGGSGAGAAGLPGVANNTLAIAR